MPLAVILVFQADKRFFVGFVFLSLDLVSFYAFNGFRNFAATRQVKIAALAARKVHVFIFRLQCGALCWSRANLHAIFARCRGPRNFFSLAAYWAYRNIGPL